MKISFEVTGCDRFDGSDIVDFFRYQLRIIAFLSEKNEMFEYELDDLEIKNIRIER